MRIRASFTVLLAIGLVATLAGGAVVSPTTQAHRCVDTTHECGGTCTDGTHVHVDWNTTCVSEDEVTPLLEDLPLEP